MKQELFKTSELSLVALLRLRDFKVLNTERKGYKTFFLFKDSNKLEKVVSDFFNHKIAVCPLSYFNALREAKSYIYKS